MPKISIWLIVLIGLLFNISAALITHFIIEDKGNKINMLSKKVNDNKKESSLAWEQIEGIERKRETVYLLYNQGEINTVVAERFSDLLASHLQEKIQLSNLSLIDAKIDHYQEKFRNEIDDNFFLNLQLNKLKMDLQNEISTLRNWSIFLQIIGLSLILARDLRRK